MSPRARHDAKEGRRSWRFDKSSSEAAASKKPYIVFLTLLLLGLVGLYLWAVWRTRSPNAHLAVIEVPGNRRVPTTPFAHNDIQHLLDVKILHTREVWTDIRDDSDFANLVGPKAQALLKKPYEKLILYISAPGISHAGKAYLTHSDFLTPGAASEGRHAVSDILAQVADAGPGAKLIVLDSTTVDVDPRLGLVVNEFVRLVEADVKRLDKESNLFVLIPAGPFQVSTTAYGDRQSLFGKYLADGLAGEADRSVVGDGDLFVTLYELYEYVRAGCAKSIDSRLGIQQTPVLLQAGIGYVPPSTDLNDERLRLTALPRKQKQPAPEPVEAIENKGNASAENHTDKAALRRWPVARAANLALMQATAGNKEGPNESTAEPKAEPAAEKQPADPAASAAKAPPAKAEAGVNPQPKPAEKAAPDELTPQEQLLSKLEKAWRLRDAIQDAEAHGVTPATFAPHLWRALEAELLFVERQVLADPVFDPPKTETKESEAEPLLPSPENVAAIEDLINTFTSLEAAIASNRQVPLSTNNRSLLARLLQVWNQYVNKQQKADLQFTIREAPEVVQLRNQARDFDLLVYSLPYYVRWHARAHQSLPINSDQHLRLGNYLDQTVELAATLSSLRAMPQLDYNGAGKLAKVREQLTWALSLRSELDEALWKGDDRGNPIILERLLATPLLAAQRRMQLLRALVQVEPDKPGGEATPQPRQDLSVSRQHWQRLQAHCLLEFRLVELALGADHARVTLLSAELDKAGTLAQEGGPEAALWVAYRSVGEQFGQCYESLSKSIVGGAADDYAIHLVDYRDVDDPANIHLDARPALQLHLKYEPELKVEIAEEKHRRQFDLKLNEPRQLVLTIRGTREKDASEPLKLDVEDALLDVTCKPTGPLDKKSGWYEQTVICDVLAKEGVTQLSGRKTTNVTFWSAASEQLNQKLTLSFTLPRPDQISLEVRRVSTPSPNWLREQDGSLTLGLFPANLPTPAVTAFQFRAHNESGKARKLRAELYVVKPRRPEKQEKHGAISPDLREQLFHEAARSLDTTQLELVAAVDDVSVAVDESAILALKALGAPPPPAAPAAASTPAQPPAAPPAINADHGMVCVLRDEADTTWVKWIETEPIPLHRYLTAKSWYESGRVVIEVSGKPDRDKYFPADGLELKWETKPDFPDVTERRIHANILEAGDEPKTLYVEVPPDDITREVYIGVNGCPRVLSFRVPCRESPDRIAGVETRLGRRSIAITKLSIPGTPQVFHVPARPVRGRESIYLDGPPPGAEPGEGDYFQEVGQPVVVAMPVDKLRVHFHVDAPVEGLVWDRGDAIEVMVGDADLGTAYGDRHLRTHFMGLNAFGVVRLDMQMEEQFIDIEPRDSGKMLDLIAKLTVERRELEWSQEVPVIFDENRPVISEEVEVPDPFELGSKQAVKIEVQELSDISKVQYWFCDSSKRALGEPVAAASLEPPVRQGKMLRLGFNVDAAGLDEGTYLLAIQVFDHVERPSGVVYTKIRIKKKEVKPVFATITGKVEFAVEARLFISVELLTLQKEPVAGFARVEEFEDNRFKFINVPAGDYILRAKSNLSTYKREVDKPVKVDKPGEVKVDFNLK